MHIGNFARIQVITSVIFTEDPKVCIECMKIEAYFIWHSYSFYNCYNKNSSNKRKGKKMSDKIKKPILSAFVEEGTFKAIQELANTQDRSVSYIVKQAILEYLQRHSNNSVDTDPIGRRIIQE